MKMDKKEVNELPALTQTLVTRWLDRQLDTAVCCAIHKHNHFYHPYCRKALGLPLLISLSLSVPVPIPLSSDNERRKKKGALLAPSLPVPGVGSRYPSCS